MGLLDIFKKKNKVEKSIEEIFDKYCPDCKFGLSMDQMVCPRCGLDLNKKATYAIKGKEIDNSIVGEKAEEKVLENVGMVYGVNICDSNSYVKNGITYHNESFVGEGGCSITIGVPEYNEVYYFFKFLLKYPIIKKPESLKKEDYSRWYFMCQGIKDYVGLHKTLVEKGFYNRASNKEILGKYNVSDIKALAGKLGIKIKGKKEELIDSLIAQTDETVLNQLLGDDYQSISELGDKWIDDNLEKYEYYTADEEYESFDAYKQFWASHNKKDILMEKYLKNIKKDKKTFGRYDYDGIIGLLQEEEGNEEAILLCYLKEALLDLSGAEGYATWREMGRLKSDISDMYINGVTPYLMRTIPQYRDYYSESMAIQAYSIKLPFNCCDLADFISISKELVNDTYRNNKKHYEDMLNKKAQKILYSKFD